MTQRPDPFSPEMVLIREMEHALTKLRIYSDEFEAALALFHESPGLSRRFREWQRIAAKQAILSVYNFAMGTKEIRTRARNTMFDPASAAIESVREALKQTFPDLGELRQTVMHEAEKHWNKERDRENRAKGPVDNEFGTLGINAAISSSIARNTYLATFAGKEVRFEMVPEKLAKLRELLTVLQGAIHELAKDHFRHRN